MLSDAGCVLLMILMASLAAGIVAIAIMDACGIKEDRPATYSSWYFNLDAKAMGQDAYERATKRAMRELREEKSLEDASLLRKLWNGTLSVK